MSKQRSNAPELIDLGPAYYTTLEYRDCLLQLDRVGRYLGGDQATYWAFRQLKQTPQSILDVGCGGGLFTQRLATHYPQAQVLGIDTSQEAIAFAQQHLKKIPVSNLTFQLTAPHLHFLPKSFDIVTATLVCHHLSDDELVDFLQKSYLIANQAIILNDLHRHPLATASFATVAPILFRNRLITHDGLLSIKKAFTRQDWLRYLQAAHIPLECCSITWHWAFRWIVLITPS